MTCNVKNGPPAHLTAAEIESIRSAVYKVLVERCSFEEAVTVKSVSALHDRLVRLITN